MLVETVPSWLATMRSIDGTQEAPGDANNPTILAWSDAIAHAFPEMARYASRYADDTEQAWCGLCVAYCMAANGIRPPYDPRDELKSYLWVDSWVDWGTPVLAGHLVAAVIAVALQRIADRDTGRVGRLAAIGAVLVVATVVAVFWWS